MERKAYLELCKRYAAACDERGAVSGEAERETLVQWKGASSEPWAYPLAYPLAYRLGYKKEMDGTVSVVHYAVLRVWGALGEVTVPLSGVELVTEAADVPDELTAALREKWEG